MTTEDAEPNSNLPLATATDDAVNARYEGAQGSLEPGAREVKRAYAVRHATVLLSIPHQTGRPKPETWLASICDALKSDSRVDHFVRPAHRAHLARVSTMYPRVEDTESALTGSDHFHSVRFSDPITFRLTVAPEQQSEFRGSRNFPKGSYYVAWDGVSLEVLWEQPSNETVSVAAGRVSVDVLREAVEKVDGEIYVQSCSPGCQNIFLHTDVVLVEPGSERAKNTYDLHYVTAEDGLGTPHDELVKWSRHANYALDIFARFKNHGRRIRDLLKLSGKQLFLLLALQQKYQRAKTQPWRSRIAAHWAIHGWRKRSRKYMADVWLASADIEVMRREWDEDRRIFKRRAKEIDLVHMFAKDASDDEVAIDSVDLSLARDSLAQASAGLDARAVVLVTGLAGVVGFLGAIVGVLLTN